MKAFVTGASGFLGGRLAEMLVAAGVETAVLARPASSLEHLAPLASPGALRIFRAELTDVPALEAAVHEATHIFHCAGCSTDWAPWADFYAANVTGTANLLRAARGAERLERFVHVSTTDVYGYPLEPCAEDGPRVDVGLPYNRTKIEGEARVWRAADEWRLPVTVVRPATIYGPRGKAFVTDIARLLRQGLMAVIGSGRAPGGFSYVDNVAEAMISAAQSPNALGNAYNLADGTGVTWREYVNALACGLGCHKCWINLPGRAALAMARGMEAPFTLGLPGRPLLTRHAVYLLLRNQEFPAHRAARDFGFSPRISWEEGIARSIAWVKEECP